MSKNTNADDKQVNKAWMDHYKKISKNGWELKNRRLFTCIIVMHFINFCFSKVPIDFKEYEEFTDIIYEDNKNCSFNTMTDYLFDERACVRVLITCHKDTKIETKQMMVSKLFDSEEIQEVNTFLNTLGKFTEKILIKKSVENIYDVHVANLVCLNYKVKYTNFETFEEFWLKKVNDKILIYRYTISLNINE